jgi:methionine sulfoxide reductase heme-binding subunit
MTLWFIARAAGFVALLAASLTVALGAAGTSGRLDHRILAQLVHRSAAVLTLAMLGLHTVLLVVDHYVDVSVGGALVPFTAGYRGYALGLGTLAVYGFLVVAATGALRGRLAASAGATRAWRAVHLSAYAAWGLAMAHGVLAGTDTMRPWALALYGVSAFVVGGAVAGRVVAGLRGRRAALPRARRLATRLPAGAAR